MKQFLRQSLVAALDLPARGTGCSDDPLVVAIPEVAGELAEASQFVNTCSIFLGSNC